MHRYVKLLFLATVTVAALLALAACGRSKPDIDVEVTQHDFGVIEQGTIAQVKIPVRNTGDAELRIEAVVTSCGCTSATLVPQVIPPGGEGTLEIRYNSGLHPDEGEIRRDVFILSNDPDESEVVITLTATVKAP